LALLAACDDPDTGPDDTAPTIHITPHCGDITGEETWYASDNRHLLECDVVVTGTLILDPGAEVYFNPGTALRVNGGTLTAVGNQHDPILMESAAETPDAGDHGGIVGTDATIAIDWLTLRHGGAEGGLLQLTGGTADIGNSTFANGPTTGIVGDGTTFTRLTNLTIAYVPTGLVLPWNAPQVLLGIIYDQVGTQSILLPDDVLTETAILPDVGYIYITGALTVQEKAQLTINGGALLKMGGDLVVHGGLSVFGDYSAPAQLEGLDHAPFAISIESSAFKATFRYAQVKDATLTIAAEELYAKSSEFTDSTGDVLTVTGHVKDNNAANLDQNKFAGAGYGLVIAPWLLGSVGTNDYSSSSFNGVAVAGGTIAEDVEVDELPSDNLMVLGSVTVDGATLSFSGGTFLFADDTSFTVENGSVEVSGASFVHAGSTAGGWYGITLGDGADYSFLDNTEVGYGGADGGANITISSSPTVRSCTIHDSAGWGIYVEAGASPEFEDNTYSNNALGNVGGP
jgi:parallel beta-helix repeat protein